MLSSLFQDLAAHLKKFHGTPVEKHCSNQSLYIYNHRNKAKQKPTWLRQTYKKLLRKFTFLGTGRL